MSVPVYPSGTVRALLATPHVSGRPPAPPCRPASTRRPLTRRSFWPPKPSPCSKPWLPASSPSPTGPTTPLPWPPAVDQRLAEGRADGWRYDALPPDREAYRLGLGGIQEIAQELFQADFMALNAEQQDAVIQALASGTPPGAAWETLDAGRFFEEMLAELTETYYAHPLAQEEIGYVGMADLPEMVENRPQRKRRPGARPVNFELAKDFIRAACS